MNDPRTNAWQYSRSMIDSQVEQMSQRYAEFIEGLLRQHGATRENAATFTLIEDDSELGGILCRAGQALGTVTVRIDAHGLKMHFEPGN